ncbi:hypothetical protein EJ08DRAFT_317938 [Tothia fuscella]|uniref:Uncharacterized protein n=1 Tax=Tothia fuscella TaxID=1048955 RepID=A0A9P4NNG9_9PEZI|nr:hypothetical protein EJ08DRAFT_317938 [Tothia fuscella]
MANQSFGPPGDPNSRRVWSTAPKKKKSEEPSTHRAAASNSNVSKAPINTNVNKDNIAPTAFMGAGTPPTRSTSLVSSLSTPTTTSAPSHSTRASPMEFFDTDASNVSPAIGHHQAPMMARRGKKTRASAVMGRSNARVSNADSTLNRQPDTPTSATTPRSWKSLEDPSRSTSITHKTYSATTTAPANITKAKTPIQTPTGRRLPEVAAGSDVQEVANAAHKGTSSFPAQSKDGRKPSNALSSK